MRGTAKAAADEETRESSDEEDDDDEDIEITSPLKGGKAPARAVNKPAAKSGALQGLKCP